MSRKKTAEQAAPANNDEHTEANRQFEIRMAGAGLLIQLPADREQALAILDYAKTLVALVYEPASAEGA